MFHRTVHALWNLYGNPYKNHTEMEAMELCLSCTKPSISCVFQGMSLIQKRLAVSGLQSSDFIPASQNIAEFLKDHVRKPTHPTYATFTHNPFMLILLQETWNKFEFLSCLNNKVAQIDEILPHRRQGLGYSAWARPRLLLVLSGHQQLFIDLVLLEYSSFSSIIVV